MQLKELKNQMFDPEDEVILNLPITIQGRKAHILSLTVANEEKNIWILIKTNSLIRDSHDPDEYDALKTNRQQLMHHINQEDPSTFFISGFLIQGKRFEVVSTRTDSVSVTDSRVCSILHHFLKMGIDLSQWEEEELDQLALLSCTLLEDAQLEDLKKEENIKLSVTLESSIRQVPVNKTIEVSFGTCLSDRKYSFQGKDEKKYSFYIDKLIHYDIWEEARHSFTDEELLKTSQLTKEQMEQMQKEYMELLPSICPEGMDLAVMEYESCDGVQLQFYSESFLEDEIVKNSSATSVMMKAEREYGDMGYLCRACILMPVEKDYNEPVSVELFSYYEEIPGETITAN